MGPAPPTFTNFTGRKGKSHDANDLLELSRVSILVYIYALGKSFILHI